MKKRKVSKWKPLTLTGELLCKGVEGLVGIEELCDYAFVSENDQKTNTFDKYQVLKIDKKKKIYDDKNQTKKKNKQDTSKTRDKDVNESLRKKRKISNNIERKYVCETSKEEKEFQICGTDGSEWIIHSDTRDADTRFADRMACLKEKPKKNKRSEIFSTEIEMSAWNGLGVPDSVLRALAEQGFMEPTVIQVRTLPPAIMGRRDILGAAETGSGKTLAFGIPILHHILEDKLNASSSEANQYQDNQEEESENEELSDEELVENDTSDLGCVQVINNISISSQNTEDMSNMSNSKLYALILTPTRELAIQIKNHLKAAAKYTGIRIAVVVGGMSIQKQERLLNHSPEIVVATPGRLWEMIQNGNSHFAQVGNIKYLVVDETDRMLEKGHFQELQNLLELLNVDEKNKKRRQNFVFSATLTMVHDQPQYLKQKKKLKITPGQKLQNIMSVLGITNPKVIDITNESGTASTLTEARIMCTLEEKDFYLYYFLQRHKGRTLIFCNSISCVRRLAQLLTLLKCNPLPLHANMVQRQRLKNLDRFRDNPHGVLLATDVAARGLDIPNVQHVVHYQVPRTSENYVHRSGRTARAQKQGLTLLLIEPTEAQCYVRVCRTLGRSKDFPLFPVVNNALDVAKKRVVLAREIDQFELASRRSTSETGWFRKALTDMDMFVDEEDVPRQLDDDEYNRNRRLVAAKKKQLNALLSKSMCVSSVTSNSLDCLSSVIPLKIENSVEHGNKIAKKRRQKNKKKRNKN